MLLRRMIEHVKAQNWTAVALDFLIVVLGVFFGLQGQQWAIEREREIGERKYLHRLHEEVEQLIDARALYDVSRAEFSAELLKISRILKDKTTTTRLTPLQCMTIVHSSFTTIPPAGLPTVTELLSAGRLDHLTSQEIRDAVLAFTQESDRARDFIGGITDSNSELARNHPDLILTELTDAAPNSEHVGLVADCDEEAMRNSSAFLNDFNNNAYAYIHYTERGVLNLSSQLKSLHKLIDAELGVEHVSAETQR